jgi:hypothetical protein
MGLHKPDILRGGTAAIGVPGFTLAAAPFKRVRFSFPLPVRYRERNIPTQILVTVLQTKPYSSETIHSRGRFLSGLEMPVKEKHLSCAGNVLAARWARDVPARFT